MEMPCICLYISCHPDCWRILFPLFSWNDSRWTGALTQSQSLVAISTGADQSSALGSDTVTNNGERMSPCPTVRPQQTVVTDDGSSAAHRPVTRPAGQPATAPQRTVISAAQLQTQTMLSSGQRIVSMGTSARGNNVVRVI